MGDSYANSKIPLAPPLQWGSTLLPPPRVVALEGCSVAEGKEHVGGREGGG